MQRILPSLALFAAAALTIYGGVLHGRLSGRWGPSEDATAAVAVIDAMPKQFGNWRLTDEQKLSDTVVSTLECVGYASRVYTNELGEQVSIAVLLGPAGPISVHTPEICYSSREYHIVEDRQATQVGSAGEDDFWRLTLEAHDVDAHRLRVYYAWTDGRRWRAAESPRIEYAGAPYLFKLQMAAAYVVDDEQDVADVGARFLKDFLPEWRKAAALLNNGQ